ncbi:hypothetical protein BDN72DRAFT_953988 [Pluteus cervinus]|uniref:Uncharacterized protein n=1 Tax=Pluteus cervinus TaxID=181527 RepID=A0ACD3BEA9_9AGAR|nr:hypothetical protein BDN72DRAFT_953988 [Pluteus cervinus]
MVDHSDGEEPPQNIFTQDGDPIRFLLDDSIKGNQRRLGLRNLIQKHGGTLVASTSITDVMLVNQPAEERARRQIAFDIHKDRNLQKIWVEPFEWVKACIRIGAASHKRRREGMPGYIGRRRTEFTEDDDRHLARYLSTRIPYKEQGGRQGDNIYKDLCDLTKIINAEERESCQWVKRHTWQSWQNRYKKNQKRFDQMIEDLVGMNPPDEARTYYRDRRLGVGSNRRGSKKQYYEEEEEEEQQPKRKRRKVTTPDDESDEVVRSKGKEKAEVISLLSEDEDLEDHNSLFSDPEYDPKLFESYEPEAGPSGTLRVSSVPQSPTNEDEDPPSLPPAASQMTLVGRAEAWPPVRGRQSEPVPRNAGPTAFRKVRTAAPTPRESRATRSPFPELSLAPSREPSQPPLEAEDHQADEPFESLPPPPSPPRVEVEQPSTPQPPSPAPQSPPVRKRKRARNPPQVLVVEGPYRNTRSRSRSVEPTAAPPARRQRRTRQDVSNDENEGQLNALSEDIQAENVPRSPAVPTTSVSVPVTETFGDEQDVEHLLIEDISTGTGGGSHVRDVTEDNAAEVQDEHEEPDEEDEDEEMEPIQGDEYEDQGDGSEHSEVGEDEEPEEEDAVILPSPEHSPSPPRRLSSDDREAVDFLRTRFRSSPEVPDLDPDPDEALAAFNQLIQTSRPVSGASMTGRGSRVASSSRRSGNNDIMGRGGTRDSNGNGSVSTSSGQQIPMMMRMMAPPPSPGALLASQLIRTPRSSLTRQRKDSVSSAESIPLSGTRASEIKMQLEDEERHSPYKPPPGTRAARLTRKTKGRRRRQ